MKKIIVYSLLVFLSVSICASARAQVKKADLAGSWYPASKERLSAMLRSYMDKADIPRIEGDIIALIAPHAGFVYSGPVAAYGFKAVRGKDVKTVVVIGFSHRLSYDGIAVFDGEAFETPLGRININKELTDSLIKMHENIYAYPRAFIGEQAIEMEIPFLQVVFKDFDMVLIAIGRQSYGNSEIIGNAIAAVLKDKEKYLLVGSTDMSHFLSYDKARSRDEESISVIKKFDPRLLYSESLLKRHSLMCGYGAICATMIASKKLGATDIEILKYANSGDTAGDKSRVVGYLSAVIVKKSGSNPETKIIKSQAEEDMLNKEQRKTLLKIARDAISTYLKERKKIEPKVDDPFLNEEMGAFVTLHKQGQLRGCIGNMIGRGPLYLTVRDMAIEAAVRDPRFRPVTTSELNDIDIEISVLSPMQLIKDPGVIEVGKHGVMVKQGFRSGVYLPQVAAEAGWDREQFMNSLCAHKAGISPDAWKKGECEIYIYEAEVFGEEHE